MTTHLEGEYKLTMTLSIKNISREHFGGYRCVVRNSLGETDGLIRLYGMILFRFDLKLYPSSASGDEERRSFFL